MKLKVLSAALIGCAMMSFAPLVASADSNSSCRANCEATCILLAGDAFGPGGGNGSQIAHCISVCVEFSCGGFTSVDASTSNPDVVEAALHLSGYFEQEEPETTAAEVAPKEDT